MKFLLFVSILTFPIQSFAGNEPANFLTLPMDKSGIAIRYGYDLVTQTPLYLGPKGSVGHYAKNLLSCKNCHLESGAKPFGNSWLDSHAVYPQYRDREGTIQTLADRINACLTHNLSGRPIPEDGPEMRSILLYMKWLGKDRQIKAADTDQQLPPLAFLNRAANVVNGSHLYEAKCLNCHGADGAGRLRADGAAYEFPPLWGKTSFSIGTSMSRLSILARFVKGNMPYETAGIQKLTDEEAWDVSAYILSKPRPAWSGSLAYEDVLTKPFDYPIGPYADPSPTEQHLLGPFQPILDFLSAKIGKRAANAASGI